MIEFQMRMNAQRVLTSVLALEAKLDVLQPVPIQVVLMTVGAMLDTL